MWGPEQQEQLRRALSLAEELCDRYGPQLSDKDLEGLADLLLRLCEPDEEYPWLPERDSCQRWRDLVARSLDEPLGQMRSGVQGQPAPPPPRVPGIVQVLVARLVVAAGLTGRRRQVARLRLWGYPLKEVARLLNLPPNAVYAHWRYAKQALRRAMAEDALDRMPAAGVSPTTVQEVDLREVLREEQARCIYRRPAHCARGRERCRTSGVCAYAARGPKA